MYLGGTKITDVGVKELQRALPRCTITRSTLLYGLKPVATLPIAGTILSHSAQRAAKRQREIVDEIIKLGGRVTYDSQLRYNGPHSPAPLPPNYFPRVVHVDLGNTSVTNAGVEHLKELTRLQLDLGLTRVTDAGLEHLKGLAQLRELRLQFVEVTDAGVEHLKGLTQLQQLWVGGPKVTDAGLEHLKGLTQLQWLDVDGAQLTDAGVEHFKGLIKLQHLGGGRG